MSRLLETTRYGPETGVPLLIVHGLFGSARNWRALAKHYARNRLVLVVDMRNHGDSFWDESHSYPDMAQDLAEVIVANGGKADVLGHSMGGKAAMVLALSHPELLRRLIVADIAPVGYAHSQIDNIEVMRGIALDQVTRRSEADTQMAAQISDAGVRAFLLQSLILSPERNRWALNLDALAANMAAIIGFPEVSGVFSGPTHFVYGTASDYVLAAYHDTIRTLFPLADFHGIDGAGHWLHAEKPRPFMALTDGLLGS